MEFQRSSSMAESVKRQRTICRYAPDSDDRKKEFATASRVLSKFSARCISLFADCDPSVVDEVKLELDVEGDECPIARVRAHMDAFLRKKMAMCLDIRSAELSKTMDMYRVARVLACGASGMIFEMYRNKSVPDEMPQDAVVAVKLFVENTASISNEIQMQKRAAEHGLAPKIIFSGHSVSKLTAHGMDYGVIAMQRVFGDTLTHAIGATAGRAEWKSVLHAAIRGVVKLSRALFDTCGLIHGDLHFGNVLVRRAGLPWVPIDFGRSTECSSEELWRDMTFYSVLHSLLLVPRCWNAETQEVLLESVRKTIRFEVEQDQETTFKMHQEIFEHDNGKFSRLYKLYSIYAALVSRQAEWLQNGSPRKIRRIVFFDQISGKLGRDNYLDYLLLSTENGEGYVLIESSKETRAEAEKHFKYENKFAIEDAHGSREILLYAMPPATRNKQ